jgi:hypothetical protein
MSITFREKFWSAISKGYTKRRAKNTGIINTDTINPPNKNIMKLGSPSLNGNIAPMMKSDNAIKNKTPMIMLRFALTLSIGNKNFEIK